MKKKRLVINFLYVENTFIYKIKDLLKNKDNKFIIDYNNILDKSLDKNISVKNKKILIASLIIKKIKKIILKNNKDCLNIYYILSGFEKEKIINLNTLMYTYFNGDIINNIYTDSKLIPDNFFDNVFKLAVIKNDP